MPRDLQRRHNRFIWLREIVRLISVVALGLVVAGVSPNRLVAQNKDDDPARQAGEETATPIAAYMPSDALYVLTIRPRELLTAPSAKSLKEQVKEYFLEPETLHSAGVVPMKIEAAAIALLPPRRGRERDGTQAAFAIRLTEPVDWKVIAEAAERQSIALGGILYEIKGLGFVLVPDERTILIAATSDEDVVKEMVLRGEIDPEDTPWPEEYLAHLGEPAISVLINPDEVAHVMLNHFQRRGDRPPPVVMQAAIMLRNTRWVGLEVWRGASPNIVAHAETIHETITQPLANELRGLASLARGTVRQLHRRAEQRKEKEKDQTPLARALPLAEQLLTSLKVETKGRLVTLTADTGEQEPIATILSTFVLPAIQDARREARCSASLNHLKQLVLAFHNYHSTFGCFPPAVIEKNGVKHSWRVAILPFVDQADLYERYRFDEPWNSEHNKKLIPLMPDVYRDPLDESEANSASYYLLTNDDSFSETGAPAGAKRGKAVKGKRSNGNKGRIFPGGAAAGAMGIGAGVPVHLAIALFTDEPVDLAAGGEGPRIRDIIDGTSNTILIVESSRDAPWTKPEDIPFDPEKIKQLKEKLGSNHASGFFAAFADGSVHFIPETIDLTTLKRLVMPADGKPVDLLE